MRTTDFLYSKGATTLVVLLLLSSCQSPSSEIEPYSVTGYVDVPGGRVFYEMYHPNAPGIPLLLIHGGPGSTSCYFGLLDEYITDRPVIRYDQLDTGLSDRPDDRSRWILPHFVEEVEAVRRSLNLSKVHVLGSSWGGTIATEFALEGDTTGVESLILAGPLISTSRWIEDAEILISQLPEEIQRTIKKHEAAGTYGDPAYVAATDSFYARFMFHQQPPAVVPECDGVEGNADIYNLMWGPTEFTATGTLLGYDRTDRLNDIKLPILFIAGEFDEARPETMVNFASQVDRARVEIIDEAGHAAMMDKPEAYAATLERFMQDVEAGTLVGTDYELEPCSKAWNAWIEDEVGTGDGQGHGPDMGSDEWKSTVLFRLGLRDKPGVPSVDSDAWCEFVDAAVKNR